MVDLQATDLDFDWDLDNRAHPPAAPFYAFALVNPKITPVPGSPKTVYEEGCLSFPGIRGDVSRPDRIEVAFQDQFRGHLTLRCGGLPVSLRAA